MTDLFGTCVGSALADLAEGTFEETASESAPSLKETASLLANGKHVDAGKKLAPEQTTQTGKLLKSFGASLIEQPSEKIGLWRASRTMASMPSSLCAFAFASLSMNVIKAHESNPSLVGQMFADDAEFVGAFRECCGASLLALALAEKWEDSEASRSIRSQLEGFVKATSQSVIQGPSLTRIPGPLRTAEPGKV